MLLSALVLTVGRVTVADALPPLTAMAQVPAVTSPLMVIVPLKAAAGTDTSPPMASASTKRAFVFITTSV
ncbi:hypothetical protein D3C76_1614150 [compost metagenome]